MHCNLILKRGKVGRGGKKGEGKKVKILESSCFYEERGGRERILKKTPFLTECGQKGKKKSSRKRGRSKKKGKRGGGK